MNLAQGGGDRSGAGASSYGAAGVIGGDVVGGGFNGCAASSVCNTCGVSPQQPEAMMMFTHLNNQDAFTPYSYPASTAEGPTQVNPYPPDLSSDTLAN